jgi:hypothetical protein
MMQEADTAESQGLLRTAIMTMENAIKLAANSHEKAYGFYQLGALHWGATGDGLSARSFFEETVTHWKKYISESRDPEIKIPLGANAMENLMLLSLSFDEYEKWAGELKGEAPHEPILDEHYPLIIQQRDLGETWSEIMLNGAMIYIRPGKTGGAPQPASGACIFHLLLHHRKKLRLSRKSWHTAVLGYSAAMNDVFSRQEQLLLSKSGPHHQTEFAIAHRFLVPFLEEYCAENPGDEVLQKTKTDMKQAVSKLEEAIKAKRLQPDKKKSDSKPSAKLPKPKPNHYIQILVLMGLGIWPFLADASTGWKILGGIALALGVLSFFGLLQARHQHSPTAHRYNWQRNAAIQREVQRQGLQGLSFKLRDYEVTQGDYLHLNFLAIDYVPIDKTSRVHMALRCVVALTMPYVVHQLQGYSLVSHGTGYTIAFGDGVSIPFYELKGPTGRLSTIQVGSSKQGNVYQVSIHPSTMPVEKIYTMANQGLGRESAIQQELGRAFMDFSSGNELTL